MTFNLPIPLNDAGSTRKPGLEISVLLQDQIIGSEIRILLVKASRQIVLLLGEFCFGPEHFFPIYPSLSKMIRSDISRNMGNHLEEKNMKELLSFHLINGTVAMNVLIESLGQGT